MDKFVVVKVFPFPKFQFQEVFELHIGLTAFEAGVLELTKVTSEPLHTGFGLTVKLATGFLKILILLTVALVSSQELIALTETTNSLPGKPHEVVEKI